MDFPAPELFPPIERIELDVFGDSVRCVMWADGDRHMQETFQARDPQEFGQLLAELEIWLCPQFGHDSQAALARHRARGVYSDGETKLGEEPEVRSGDQPRTGDGPAGPHEAARDQNRGGRGPAGGGADGGPA